MFFIAEKSIFENRGPKNTFAPQIACSSNRLKCERRRIEPPIQFSDFDVIPDPAWLETWAIVIRGKAKAALIEACQDVQRRARANVPNSGELPPLNQLMSGKSSLER